MTFLPEMHNLSLDTRLLGICTLGDGRVTELFKGPQGGLYYLSPSEQRMSVASNDERIEFMDPEDVETRLQAAAEPKVGLGDKDRQLARLDLGLEHLMKNSILTGMKLRSRMTPFGYLAGQTGFRTS